RRKRRNRGTEKRHLGWSVSSLRIRSSCTRRVSMLKNTRVQMIAVLAIGGLLGYAAASGRFDAFRKANAEPPPTVSQKAGSSSPEAPICCREGTTKAELVALADPNVKEAIATAQEKSGKKPNILFIMGDDVGWFNIGAYHRGIMSGKTP